MRCMYCGEDVFATQDGRRVCGCVDQLTLFGESTSTVFSHRSQRMAVVDEQGTRTGEVHTFPASAGLSAGDVVVVNHKHMGISIKRKFLVLSTTKMKKISAL